MIGFSEHVDLGDVGVLRDDPTVALRFELPDSQGAAHSPDAPPARDGVRLLRRTRVVAHATRLQPAGRSLGRRLPHLSKPDAPRPSRLVRPRADRSAVLFVPPHTVALRIRTPNANLLGEPLTIQRGPESEFRYAGSESRGLRYDAYLGADNEVLLEALPSPDRPRYLALPSDLPARVTALAHTWTDGLPTPEAKALAIESHLRHDYAYDLHSPSGGKPQPVDHFLFESRRGHCEFFSTAMALMLRSVGIPSRNITGFVGGTWNRFGRYYAVREGDAHSWVEAYLDDPLRPTWRTFDPTPASGAQPVEPPGGFYYYMRDFIEALSQRWNTYVVGYDLNKQIHLFDDVTRHYERFRSKAGVDRGVLDRLTRAPAVGAFGIALTVVAYALWRRRRLTPDERALRAGGLRVTDPRLESVVALFRTLESAMLVQGVSRPAALPPLRHAEELCARRHPLGEEVLSLTRLYLAARFGGERLTELGRRDFERRVRDIRTSPRRPPESSPTTLHAAAQ